MKFIIIETEVGKDNVELLPIIFPKNLNHIDVYEAIRDVLRQKMEKSHTRPVSAGDITLPMSGIKCGGVSVTLNIDSHPLSAVLINTIDYRMIFDKDDKLIP